MKVDIGTGTPIFLSPRKIGGVEIIQGTARIKLRDATEVHELRKAPQLVMPEGQEKMTTIGNV